MEESILLRYDEAGCIAAGGWRAGSLGPAGGREWAVGVLVGAWPPQAEPIS